MLNRKRAAGLSFHENFGRTEKIDGPSDRRFGLWFAAISAVIGGLKLWHGSDTAWYWAIAAGLLLTLALAFPGGLGPLNRLWLKLGLGLFKVISPIMMAVLYFTTVVPIGLIIRLTGRDLLRLRRDPAAVSYWIVRDPPGPRPEDMQHQF